MSVRTAATTLARVAAPLVRFWIRRIVGIFFIGEVANLIGRNATEKSGTRNPWQQIGGLQRGGPAGSPAACRRRVEQTRGAGVE